MTRDQLFSLRRGCTLRRIQKHDRLPELATYIEWKDAGTFQRIIRDSSGHEHSLSEREICSLYEPA